MTGGLAPLLMKTYSCGYENGYELWFMHSDSCRPAFLAEAGCAELRGWVPGPQAPLILHAPSVLTWSALSLYPPSLFSTSFLPVSLLILPSCHNVLLSSWLLILIMEL